MNALIVGPGKIGRALSPFLNSLGWTASMFAGRKAGSDFHQALRSVDVVFLTISTKDKGEAALAFISVCIEEGVPVVTCEKGALAYHYETLKPHLSKIGYSATVGCESNMLTLIGSLHHSHDPIQEISAILNGTRNFIAWAIQNGCSPEKAVEMARSRGLCEPGQTDLASTFDAERRDAMMKSAILFNAAGLETIISPDDFSYYMPSDTELRAILAGKPGRHFVVTISKRDGDHRNLNLPFEEFRFETAYWQITGSFIEGAEQKFRGCRIDQEYNALVLRTLKNGRCHTGGLGAGIEPTVRTVYGDALRQIK